MRVITMYQYVLQKPPPPNMYCIAETPIFSENEAPVKVSIYIPTYLIQINTVRPCL